jgi:hypothetical protein
MGTWVQYGSELGRVGVPAVLHLSEHKGLFHVFSFSGKFFNLHQAIHKLIVFIKTLGV